MTNDKKQYVVYAPYRNKIYIWDEYTLQVSKKHPWNYIDIEKFNWGEIVYFQKAVVLGEI